MLGEIHTQMFDIKDIAIQTKIRLCLDCGKCTVVCPVAKYDRSFNPRLIAQQALRQNNNNVNKNIWSCIGCNMCMERCNYNVNFTEFIRFLRSRELSNGSEIKFSHSGITQAITHLMTNKHIQQKRLSWLPDDIKTTEHSTTAFFVGCAPYFDVLFNDLGIKTIDGTIGALRLLNHASTPFCLLSNERCCGRDILLLGDTEEFLALAQANLDELNKNGIKEIITSCPECYYTLKIDYPRFLTNWNIKITHLTEILAPLIENQQIHLGKMRQKITYQDPCTLGRYSRIFRQPRIILESIKELQIMEMTDNCEKAICCGASPWAFCGSVNKQIQQERLAQANDTGADILVTACPKCQIHLTCAQKNVQNEQQRKIKIKDIFHLASESLWPEEVP